MAVIRSAVIAPFRTRLSEARLLRADASAHAPGVHRSAEEVRLDALQEQIEKQIRAEIAAETQAIYAQERERGHAEGHAQGLAQAQAGAAEQLDEIHQQLRETMHSTLSDLEQAQRTQLAKLEASVGEIAFAAVCRIVGHQAVSRAFVLGMVEHTCAQLRSTTKATARMHPGTIELLRALMQGEELSVRGLTLQIVADDSLQLGGCVIEADCGTYDGALETQLRRLHAVLAGEQG